MKMRRIFLAACLPLLCVSVHAQKAEDWQNPAVFEINRMPMRATFVTDQQNLKVIAGKAHGLAVHLGDQRAGRINRVQLALSGGIHDGR